MSIEEQYYENTDFWAEELFANQKDRFRTVARMIPGDARTLLDVGCGNGAFVHYLMDSERCFESIHATDRSQVALAHVQANKTRASIDNLPFAEGAFDIVTCLEVIEHLPLPIYEKGLSEICRIARRYAMIGVPFAEDIERDRVGCPSCGTLFNPNYHMRRFDEPTLSALLRPHGFEPRGQAFSGGMRQYYLVSDLLERRRRKTMQKNPFATAIPCPVCWYRLPPANGAERALSSAIAAKASEGGGGVKEMLKQLLEKPMKYGWIVMLYERTP